MSLFDAIVYTIGHKPDFATFTVQPRPRPGEKPADHPEWMPWREVERVTLCDAKGTIANRLVSELQTHKAPRDLQQAWDSLPGALWPALRAEDDAVLNFKVQFTLEIITRQRAGAPGLDLANLSSAEL
jgi:hypothetical protein